MDLLQAAANGDLNEIRRLIEIEKVSSNIKNNDGSTPLHVAAYMGRLETVQYLIEKAQANPYVEDNDRITPLHKAAENGHLAVMRYLLETVKLRPDVRAKNDDMPVDRAAANGHLAVVQYLIERKYLLGKRGYPLYWKRRSPLHIAAQAGQLAVVRYLIEEAKYISPNAKDEKGNTPLFDAAQRGHLAVVQYLIETAKADPNAKGRNDWTLLHIAAETGRLEVMRYLIEKAKADPNIKDRFDWTPLHIATRKNSLEMVQYLIEEAKADPNDKISYDGRTPLHVAASLGTFEVVKYLIEKAKADPNIQSTNGWTPFHYAAENYRLSIVRYLINFAKTDPEAQKKYDLEKISKTNAAYPCLQALALMIAIEHNDLNAVKKLYSNEIEILCLQEFQYSLLAKSLSYNNFEAIPGSIVQWLLDQHELRAQSFLSSGDKIHISRFAFIRAHIIEIELLLNFHLLNFHLYDYVLLGINQLLKFGINDGLLLLYRSKIQFVQENYLEAKEDLLKIINAKNEYAAEAYLQLGRIYVKEMDYRAAEQAFSETIKSGGSLTPEAYFELGSLEQQMKNWPKANEHYTKAIETSKKINISDELKLKIYQQQAFCLSEIGIGFRNQEDFAATKKYFEQAIEAYEELLKVKEMNEIAINKLGKLPRYLEVNYVNQLKIVLATMGVTDKLLNKSVRSDVCPIVAFESNNERDQCAVFEVLDSEISSSPTHSNNPKEVDAEQSKKSSAVRLNPWFSPGYLLGASNAGYQLISNYLSSFVPLLRTVEEKATNVQVSTMVTTGYTNHDGDTNSHDDSSKTAKPTPLKPVPYQITLQGQLYLSQYIIGCVQNSRFWPLVSDYLHWLQQLLPWNQLYPLTKESKATLQAYQKMVRELINKIEKQKITRIGASSFFEEILLPLQNNLLNLSDKINHLLLTQMISSAQLYEVATKINEFKSELNNLNLKQLNKTLRYAEIKQVRLEKQSQQTGYEIETDLLIKHQKNKNQKWSIEKTSCLDEVDNPKVYTANNNTIFWSDSLYKNSLKLEQVTPPISKNVIKKT